MSHLEFTTNIAGNTVHLPRDGGMHFVQVWGGYERPARSLEQMLLKVDRSYMQ